MTSEENFLKLSSHMKKGLTIHDQMSNIYGFLKLKGYQKLQEYRYYDETKTYKFLHNFFLNHYNKIIPDEPIEKLDLVPSNWYKHVSQDVDTGTKRNMIKELSHKWVNWERETKDLLQNIYKELFDAKETCAALMIADVLKEVEQELIAAQAVLIDLETISYDLSLIVDNQEKLYKKYCKKIKSLFKNEVI